jgi:hypothetical protein
MQFKVDEGVAVPITKACMSLSSFCGKATGVETLYVFLRDPRNVLYGISLKNRALVNSYEVRYDNKQLRLPDLPFDIFPGVIRLRDMDELGTDARNLGFETLIEQFLWTLETGLVELVDSRNKKTLQKEWFHYNIYCSDQNPNWINDDKITYQKVKMANLTVLDITVPDVSTDGIQLLLNTGTADIDIIPLVSFDRFTSVGLNAVPIWLFHRARSRQLGTPAELKSADLKIASEIMNVSRDIVIAVEAVASLFTPIAFLLSRKTVMDVAKFFVVRSRTYESVDFRSVLLSTTNLLSEESVEAYLGEFFLTVDMLKGPTFPSYVNLETDAMLLESRKAEFDNVDLRPNDNFNPKSFAADGIIRFNPSGFDRI